jgi:hypothetical protein
MQMKNRRIRRLFLPKKASKTPFLGGAATPAATFLRGFASPFKSM